MQTLTETLTLEDIILCYELMGENFILEHGQITKITRGDK